MAGIQNWQLAGGGIYSRNIFGIGGEYRPHKNMTTVLFTLIPEQTVYLNLDP